MNDRNDSHERNEPAARGPGADDFAEMSGLADHQHLIDRLVAGDLDDARRRELLAWLDEQPSRWRRCAVGFLEAQMWQEALGGVASRARTETASRNVVATGRERHRRAWPPVRALSAVAAAVLFAFVLGTLTGSARPWSVGWAESSRPTTRDAPVTARDSDPEAPSPLTPTLSPRSGQGEGAGAVAESPERQRTSGPVQTFAVMKVATRDSGTREVHIPVLDGPAIDERWVRLEPEAIPEYVQRQLERHGYQLQQRRRFLQVQLEDGRQAVIPVDQYQVSLAGHGSS